MGERKTVDWKAAQCDRDGGTTVAELVKKYGVSSPTIYANTHGSANGNGKKGRRSRLNGKADQGLDSLLSILLAKRKKLDAAIAAVQALEG